MTETTAAEPRDAAQDVIAMTSATLAHDLVAAMLNELRTIPAHWTTLAESRQQQSIDTLKERARAIVDKALTLLAGSNFPAVPATLDFVANRKGISAGLTIDKGAIARHALFDAQGQRVLVVIVDPKQWCDRLDDIKAKRDQGDLFDPAANYDPARDQPGYRRDQDPFVPAGPTWAELKKQLKGDEPAPAEGAPATPPTDGTPPNVEGDADVPPPGEHALELITKLAAIGVAVTMADIDGWTGLQFNVAEEWVEAYAEGMQTLADRPDFLPVPNKEGK